MKIAVASMDRKVSEHFGRCEKFLVYETADGKIKNESSIANPGHGSGGIPSYLETNGINVMIAGGMGKGAVDRLTQKNIEVIRGAEGDTRAVVESYLKGDLVSKDTPCKGHGDDHDCNCGEEHDHHDGGCGHGHGHHHDH